MLRSAYFPITCAAARSAPPLAALPEYHKNATSYNIVVHDADRSPVWPNDAVDRLVTGAPARGDVDRLCSSCSMTDGWSLVHKDEAPVTPSYAADS
ncbi:hypothetical protein PISMIDRAFT_399978 [Pisolithus microcarpus 441]|uniref:Uncharacterized protein n=1 Tax=Pisolithus microcarpus 441 TaxID=765257 RepID=A0A0C9YTE3_9AGAM|nr:hypothetical protein BKA83DRAFT_399978 [Pisolithus microcarpus]KIK13532.1 hypothetical protein PISMIDRAFT_399978 [Pisolithus microcarpus 441]